MKNKFTITVLCFSTERLFLYLKVNNQTSDAPLMLFSARSPYPKALKVPTGTRKGVAV